MNSFHEAIGMDNASRARELGGFSTARSSVVSLSPSITLVAGSFGIQASTVKIYEQSFRLTPQVTIPLFPAGLSTLLESVCQDHPDFAVRALDVLGGLRTDRSATGEWVHFEHRSGAVLAMRLQSPSLQLVIKNLRQLVDEFKGVLGSSKADRLTANLQEPLELFAPFYTSSGSIPTSLPATRSALRSAISARGDGVIGDSIVAFSCSPDEGWSSIASIRPRLISAPISIALDHSISNALLAEVIDCSLPKTSHRSLSDQIQSIECPTVTADDVSMLSCTIQARIYEEVVRRAPQAIKTASPISVPEYIRASSAFENLDSDGKFTLSDDTIQREAGYVGLTFRWADARINCRDGHALTVHYEVRFHTKVNDTLMRALPCFVVTMRCSWEGEMPEGIERVTHWSLLRLPEHDKGDESSARAELMVALEKYVVPYLTLKDGSIWIPLEEKEKLYKRSKHSPGGVRHLSARGSSEAEKFEQQKMRLALVHYLLPLVHHNHRPECNAAVPTDLRDLIVSGVLHAKNLAKAQKSPTSQLDVIIQNLSSSPLQIELEGLGQCIVFGSHRSIPRGALFIRLSGNSGTFIIRARENQNSYDLEHVRVNESGITVHHYENQSAYPFNIIAVLSRIAAIQQAGQALNP